MVSYKKNSYLEGIINLYNSDKKGRILILCLVAIIIVVFYPTLNNWFVYWDDPEYILQNGNLSSIGAGWSWHSIKHMFTSEVGANYDPLPIFTFALEKYFFAQDTANSPFIYHLDNLLLHIICSVSVFVFFKKLGLNKGTAFVGALLFGIHPMRVESVAWITERKDVLYGTFYVFALITYVNYVRSADKKVKWYLLTVLWSVLAYFSKIQAVSLPLSMIAVDIYFDRKWLTAKTLILEKMTWWSLSVAFAAINLYYLSTKHVLNEEAAVGGYGVIHKIAIGAYAYTTYILKLIYPYKLVAVYTFPVVIPYYYYFSILFVAFFFALVWKFRRYKFIISGSLFFTVNIMFLLQIVSAGRAYLADRFTYMAYIGLFLIIAKCIEMLIRRFPQRILLISTLVTCYFLMLCVITFRQCKVWENTITLWQHYIDENKDDYFGYTQLGCFLMDMSSRDNNGRGPNKMDPQMQTAMDYLHTADERDSITGRRSPAITAYIYDNLSLAYLKIQDPQMAAFYLSKAIDVHPELGTYSKRAVLYYEQKKYALAINDFNEILKLDHSDNIAYYRRALAKGFLGHCAEALPDIDSAIHYYDKDPKYFIVRSQLERKLSDTTASRSDAEKAKQMGGNVPPELFQ